MKYTLALWLASAAWACQAVEGDHILGRDVAAANAGFTALDPAAAIAPAPMAGAQRVLHPAELLRLARQNGILVSAPLGELCFERAAEPLTDERLMPVLQSALGIDGARIELLDYSRYRIPRGALEFNRAGLSSAGLWRGRVAYAEGRTAPVWARVQITTLQTWLEASQTLVAGKPIGADQLTVRTGPRFPFGLTPVDSLERAAGKIPLRTIRIGAPIYASLLATPPEVGRGDKVAVEVSSGGARLSFEATAESPGHAGESILIRNPQNGRLFQARIEGRGKVAVKR